MRKRTSIIACTCALLFAVGCGDDSANNDPNGNNNNSTYNQIKSNIEREKDPSIGEEAEAKIAHTNNAFAFDMYARIRSDEGKGVNTVFSPTSMTIALSQLYAGAKGETATEIANAMRYDSWQPADLFRAFNWLDQKLESRAQKAFEAAKNEASQNQEAIEPKPEDFRLHIVNSLWSRKDLQIETPFLDTLALNYGAGVFLADFVGQPEVERQNINKWVSGETKDRINDLIPQGRITSDTACVLVNAVHLKLPWKDTFEERAPIAFKTAQETEVSAPSIGYIESTLYSESNAGLQAVSIKLKGSEVHLVVVAPPVGGLDAFEDSLTAESFQALLDGMQEKEVDLQLPTVNFTTPTLALKSKLQDMGMKLPFDEVQADFSGITQDTTLSVDDVLHKAMLGIDINGVEAAAATAVTMVDTGVAEPPVKLTVDRPYFVAIVDAPTKVLLFAGHVMDPTK